MKRLIHCIGVVNPFLTDFLKGPDALKGRQAKQPPDLENPPAALVNIRLAVL